MESAVCLYYGSIEDGYLTHSGKIGKGNPGKVMLTWSLEGQVEFSQMKVGRE